MAAGLAGSAGGGSTCLVTAGGGCVVAAGGLVISAQGAVFAAHGGSVMGCAVKNGGNVGGWTGKVVYYNP